MSLKGKFKTNSKLVAEGVWFDVITNSDKTLSRVKLRRSGRGNKIWVNSFRDHTANADMENLTAAEDELITAKVFVEACVVDWEHFQLDDDGVELAFSKEAALEILTDPDWVDLLKDWQLKANGIAGFQDGNKAKREGEAGN